MNDSYECPNNKPYLNEEVEKSIDLMWRVIKLCFFFAY